MHDTKKNVLIIDIETVSGSEDITKLPAAMKSHWERKAGFIRNTDDKTADELYTDRSAIYAEFGKVIVIGMAVFHETSEGKQALRVKTLASHDEKELLSSFAQFLEEKFDQEELRLCAHNGKEFDFPYLCRRMLVNSIKIPWSLNMNGKKPWEVQHKDTMEMWKFGDWKSFTSLDLLTTLFDIPSSKKDMEGSMVSSVYYAEENGLERIKEYCKGDVIATAQLYLRLNNQPLIPNDQITIV